MSKQKKIVLQKKKIVIRSSPKHKLKARINGFLRRHRQKLPRVGMVFLLVVLVSILLILGINGRGEKDADIAVATPQIEAVEPTAKQKTAFEYPEQLPSFAQEVPYNYVTEVIAKDTLLEAFFKGKGITAAESREIAFQAKYSGLLKLKASQTLYSFTPEEPKKGYKEFFIYQVALDSFAVITLEPKPEVTIHTIDLTTRVNHLEGIVKDNFLWISYLDDGGIPQLIPEIGKALKWQVDFYHVNPNYRYKVLYEEKWHEDKRIGIGKLLAVYYQNLDTAFYAFPFIREGTKAYYDEHGSIVRMRFLKSPVEYNIINSHFNLNRFHPIHKKIMEHRGTDYHANLNDPVFAVGKGEILAASSTKGNGNYVKIKHDDKYQSQYLHLNGFADGIKRGKIVEQGDVIGYAGKTGYATGVHVCFRFRVDGVEVDYTKQEVVASTENAEQIGDLEAFQVHRDSLKAMLDNIIIR